MTTVTTMMTTMSMMLVICMRAVELRTLRSQRRAPRAAARTTRCRAKRSSREPSLCLTAWAQVEGECCFHGLVTSLAAISGILNPMQFSNLLRASGVSMHNLHLEMSWYTKFDLDGQVGISVGDLRKGIEKFLTEKTVHTQSVQQLIRYIRELGNSDAENFSF